MEERKNKLVINPVFQPLFSDEIKDPRYYQTYGGRGSGKSFVVSIAAVQKTYSKYKHKILYLRQSMSSSEDSTIADVRAAIAFLGVEDDFREKQGLITNKKTGATISFKGIQASGTQTAKLKSLSGVTTLIIEEAEEVSSFDEFSKIDESIRILGKPLKIILVYNPGTALQSWLHTEWFVDGLPNVDRFHDTVYMHTTYLDNLHNLAPSVVQRYEDLKNSNPTYYRNTILAEWTLEVANRIYDGWERYEIFENQGDVFYGLDFGYGGNDSTALVKINNFDGVYHVEEIFCRNDLTISTTAQLMLRHKIPFTARIYADSAVPTLITEIKNKGYTGIRKCRKEKLEVGIKKIQDKVIAMVGYDQDVQRWGLYEGFMTFRQKNGKYPHEPDALAAMRYGINSHKVNSAKSRGEESNKGVRRRKARRIMESRGDFI